MKHLPVIALLLTGCTTVNLEKGTLFTMGNSQNFTMTHHGDSVHWDNMDHAAVWDASGRFIGNVATGVADVWLASGVAKAVSSGAGNGFQLLTATIPSGIQKTTSRKTNRATPVPVIR